MLIMGSLGNQLPSAKSQCYQAISLNVPRYPQITCGLLKKTLRESANLAELSYKVVVSQTLPVSGLLPARKLETTKATLNSRNLEVKIEGTMERIPCNVVAPCSFLMSCFQRIDRVNFQVCLIPGISLPLKAKNEKKFSKLKKSEIYIKIGKY